MLLELIVYALVILYNPCGILWDASQKHSAKYISSQVSSDGWGTYRGNLYFGMRSTNPASLLTGIMWFGSGAPKKIRHYCDLSDDLEAWGWVEHNGRNYGKEVIVDRPNNLRLEVNFYIPPSKDWWINSISGQKLDQALPMDVTFIYYVAGQHVNSRIRFEQRERFAIAQGYDPNLNHFRFKFSSNSPYSLHELGAPHDYAWDAVKLLLPSGQNSIPSDFNRRKKKNNFLSIQYQYEDNFKLDVQFSKPKGTICSDIELTSMHFGIATVGPVDFEIESKRFQRRLFRTFKIPRQDHLYCTCKFALSNLLGSISYFYGTSFVRKENDFEKVVVETAPFELFTDIPSRATFPRGFLWDSGFHNMIISRWNPWLSLKILKSWAHRFEPNGWIAREQIPGPETRRAVPVEYVIQHTKHANPPALLFSFMNLAKTAAKAKGSEKMMAQLRMIFPMLERNLKWLIRTQRGQIHPEFCRLLKGQRSCPNVLKLPAFRWRGRSKHHNLNSGLDDYPRGEFANRYELHVDLACWVAFGAKSMLELYRILGIRNELNVRKFIKLYRQIRFSLEYLHWDEEHKCFSDLTISAEGHLMHVRHEGYVNLFPLIFGFVHPDSLHFKATLDLIEDPNRLWTPYGLRSLSKSDPYYMRGDQYWTGPIWININYLVLASLHKNYLEPSGKFYGQAERIYTNLRRNIMDNMVDNFAKTKTIWEQYSDVDGRGMRSRPFTGWSSLVILIASEQY